MVTGAFNVLSSDTNSISIAIDSLNFPYIAYQDISKNVIVMKYSGSWETVGCPVESEQQTVGGYVLRILAEEAWMIRSLRLFFCQSLQEISADKCLNPERKMNIAKDLLCAAAQKEAALAEVLKAVSKS